MTQQNIYRIPPYVLGAEVMLAHQLQDARPWSLINHRVDQHFAETQGEGITVAVLDTGLWKHNDLPEPVFSKNFTPSPTVYDNQGHGTHVAGTIGARLDGSGVVGWAPKCKLACCKVLGDDGSGTNKGVADGILYAVEQKADIINMSLGGGHSDEIREACAVAKRAGVVIMAAAGNDGRSNSVDYPARYRTTLAIASYRKDGRISDFSSRGPQVDMAFPGEEILSTWLDDTFRVISGTSMATPAASGLAALMLAYQRKHSIELADTIVELREHWTKNALDAGADGFDHVYGWGIPDVEGIIRSERPSAAPLLLELDYGDFDMSTILELLLPVILKLIESLIDKPDAEKAAITGALIQVGKTSANPLDILVGQAAACYAKKTNDELKAELATANAMSSAYADYKAAA